MPRPICPLVGAGLLLLLGGCATSGPAYGPPPAGAAAVVDMTNTFSFRPELVRIPVGGTVVWRNRSLVSHTVTIDPAKVRDRGAVSLPRGAQPFDSGSIPRGQIWPRTFVVPGTYRYVCLPHYDVFGMVGTVLVGP
ncbi:cupredoxin domain-containing protein [Benzoatithermus flavus]|uniref:Plastocyanin/azurin family copper-binding protein n=1 Tax=Benzoatithermus flavus TaxID=3108223 RepID=A0ABU8XU14_9PROT